MSRFASHFVQINDAVGAPVPGGLLYTFATGTTNNKATYVSGAALAAVLAGGNPATGANTNPVVADAAGIVGPVFMLPGEAYTFVEKTPAGVTLRTENSAYSGMLTSDDLITRVKQIASNPLDYGAVGDGSADEFTMVQDAIDGATANGVVDLLGLTFRCDSQIVLRSGITLRNGTLDFRNCTDAEFIKAAGTLGAGVLLTADALMGDGAVVVASAAGLAEGDMLALCSSDKYIAGAGAYRGEPVTIQSIGGLTINTNDIILDKYEVATSARIHRVAPVEDVTLGGLTILGSVGIAGPHDMIALYNCRRVTIHNCVLDGLDYVGISILGGAGFRIADCTIANGGTMAAVAITDSVKDARITGCTFDNLEFSVAVGGSRAASAMIGIPRNVTIEGNTFTRGNASAAPMINIGSEAQFVYVRKNFLSAFGGAVGDTIACACVDAVISDNEISRNGAGSPDAMQLTPWVPLRPGSMFTLTVTRNRIVTDGTGIMLTSQPIVGGSGALGLIDISDNLIVAGGGNGVRLLLGSGATYPTYGTIRTARNIAPNSTVEITSSHAAVTVEQVLLDGNQANSATVTGTALSIAKVRSLNNLLALTYSVISCGSASHRGDVVDGKLFIDECGSIQAYDCDAHGGIEVDATTQAFTRCVITGGYYDAPANISPIEIDASAAARSYGVRIRDLTAFSAAGPGAGKGNIDITGLIDDLLISGVWSDRTDDSAGNIVLAGDAAGGMTQVRILNCQLANGTYGIVLTNHTTTKQWTNNFKSMASGDVSGAVLPLVTAAAYTVTNGTTDRAYDADTAVVTETNDVLYTLLNDLMAAGIVSRA